MVDRPLRWGFEYLMVSPEHYTLADPINPWMEGNRVDTPTAVAQWHEMVHAIEATGARVHVVSGTPGMADQVFAMNMGFVYDGNAIVSRFRHPARQVEQPRGLEAFTSAGLTVIDPQMPEHLRFEAGDAFVVNGTLVAANGPRSDGEAWKAIGALLGLPVQILNLIDPRFYHLDTCFCPLDAERTMIFPDAFDRPSLNKIARLVERPVELTSDEAVSFAANAIVVGHTVIAPPLSPRLRSKLLNAEFELETVATSEFIASGGSVRCCTLPMDLRSDNT